MARLSESLRIPLLWDGYCYQYLGYLLNRGSVTDWIPMVIGGGLALAGVMFFMNKYSYALGALGGVGFLYAAKAFTGTGEACLISAARLILG